MACERGRAEPNQHTKVRLFADSAGYCQRPGCSQCLFVDTATRNVHIAEIAHIIAASDKGPRASSELSDTEKASYDNLILLCANCHTLVDKAPDSFPDHLVQDWKRRRVEQIRELFGITVYSDRHLARRAIESAIAENRYIFENYNPNMEYRYDPESEQGAVWVRKLKSKILPNNRKILAILDANKHHLLINELNILEDFRQHVDDLEAKHIGGVSTVASQYPAAMSEILKDVVDQ